MLTLQRNFAALVVCTVTVLFAHSAASQNAEGWRIDGPLDKRCSPTYSPANWQDCPTFYDVDHINEEFSTALNSGILPLQEIATDHAGRIETLEQNLDAALDKINIYEAQISKLQADLKTVTDQLRQTQTTVGKHRDDFNDHVHDGSGSVVIR